MGARGAIKKDWRGFDDLVKRVKEHLNRNGVAFVVYMKDKGFSVRRQTSEALELLVIEGLADEVGTYNKDVDFDSLIDDCIFVLDNAVKQSQKGGRSL